MKNQEIELHRCCICDEVFMGHGNNPAPLKEKGRCCDSCEVKVTRARLRDSYNNWRTL